MATSNVFLILSESMFQQRGTSGLDDVDPASAYGTGAANRPGAIEVLSFTFNVKQVGTEQSGRPRSIEAVTRSEFEFEKAVDARSPKLFKYCCEGTYIRQAECQIFGPVRDTPYLTYHMAHVHVSTYQPSGGKDVPVEKIGLTFGEMSVKFNNAGMGDSKHGNDRRGTVKTMWSWVLEGSGLEPLAKIGGLEGSAL